MVLLTSQLISEGLMQAICWTIVHSLWQGVGLAVLAAIVIQLTKKAPPVLRYNLLAILFLLFIVASGITFGLQFSKPSHTLASALVAGTTQEMVTLAPEEALNFSAGLTLSGTISQLTAFCTRYSSVIVLLWFAVFLYKCLRIIVGVQYIARLRNQGTSYPDAFWQEKVSQLASMLHINVPVQLLQSELVKVPMVVGVLKPIILVPAGMLAQIAPDQVEAILLHELAHIRRRDYLINLLQSVAEVVFFFNPAILWVSSLMRQERENCCDDMAIAAIQNKRRFLQALVTFQEYSFAHLALAPAFAGRKGSLTDRVKRIVYNHNTPLLRHEKLLLAFCLLLLTVAAVVRELPVRKAGGLQAATQEELILYKPMVAPAQLSDLAPEPVNEASQKPAKYIPKPQATVATEKVVPEEVTEGMAHKSSDGETDRYRFRKEGVVYEVAKREDEIVALKVNGETLGAAAIEAYKAMFKSLQEQLEQGEIAIVVDGRVPETDAVPENPVMVGFIKNGTITTNHHDTTYEVSVRNHKTVALTIDEVPVALSEIQYHKSLIEELVQEALADRVYAELSARALAQLNKKQTSIESEVPAQKKPSVLEPSLFKFQITTEPQDIDALALARI